MDGRGGKPPAILTEGLTPKDSRLEPVTSPRIERVHILPIELTLGALNLFMNWQIKSNTYFTVNLTLILPEKPEGNYNARHLWTNFQNTKY